MDVTNPGIITHNIWGNDLVGQVRRNGSLTRYYHLKDHLGSVRVTVDASGNSVAYDDYDPCLSAVLNLLAEGMLMDGRSYNAGQADNRYRFLSKEKEIETGIDWLDVRGYDSRVGRFLSVDPLGGIPRLAPWSPYHYSYDNPLRFKDPGGMLPEDDEATKRRSDEKPAGQIETLLAKVQEEVSEISDFLASLAKPEKTEVKLAASSDVLESPGLPAENPVVTSDFSYGRPRHVVTNNGAQDRPHNGIDFGMKQGTAVLAASGGIASTKGSQKSTTGFGLSITINHGKGNQTIYGHLSQSQVGTKTIVSKGEVIGFSGNSGNTNKPHLHFEYRQNGAAKDPAAFVPQINNLRRH